jgi:hypothetical protein
MRAPFDPQPAASPARLAGLLVSAAASMNETPVPAGAGRLAPAGTPITNGRLAVGRLRHWLPADGRLVVLVGFATACWLGPPDAKPPDLGRHVYRSTTAVDGRGRVLIDRRSRAWLATADPASFQAIALPLAGDGGGLLVVPVEDYARRIEAVLP